MAFTVSTGDGLLKIRFTSSTLSETVNIYDVNGRLIDVVSSMNGNEQNRKISVKGIYLVSDGKTTVKIRTN